jgi:hypothetical protein
MMFNLYDAIHQAPIDEQPAAKNASDDDGGIAPGARSSD